MFVELGLAVVLLVVAGMWLTFFANGGTPVDRLLLYLASHLENEALTFIAGKAHLAEDGWKEPPQ